MKKKERMKELIKWASLAQTIHEIYTDLIEAKIENNNQKYEQSLYHLRLASDVENKIYASLELKIEDYETVEEEIITIVENTNLPTNKKEKIEKRMLDYLFAEEHLNPFPSTSEDWMTSYNEDAITIRIQCQISYYRKYLLQIEKYLNHPSKQDAILIEKKYKILFQSKILERLLLAGKTLNNQKDEREKCYLFGYDQGSVDGAFVYFVDDLLNKSLLDFITPNAINSIEDGLISKINIEVLFSLLNEREFSKFFYQISKEILQNPFYTSNKELEDSLLALSTIISNYFNQNISSPSKKRVPKVN